MWPGHPGLPPYGDPYGGCDPFPDGNVVGPLVAPAIYWTPKYKTIRQPQQGFIGGLSYLLEPNALPRACRSYWHVECFAIEKQFLTTEAEAAFSGNKTPTEKLGSMQGAHPSSQLKVLLQWPSARQEQRMLIADIGTGIDIVIPPTTLVTAVILVPDPTGVPVPGGLAGLSDESTATIITARATPVAGGGGRWNGRYTQTRLVTAGTPVLDEIPRFARWVQIYVADPTTVAPPTVPAPGSVTASWVFDSLVTPPTDVAPVGFLGTYPSPTVQAQRAPIPGDAKLISLSSGSDQLVTIVYGLSL